MFPRSIQVLLVEDSPSDVWLIREALRLAQIPVELTIMRDGAQASRYLKQACAGETRSADLVLLDLNLPGKNGNELLAEIQSAPGLRMTPVVVLSSSNAEEDRRTAYGLNASCFLTKPDSLPGYVKMVREIANIWLSGLALGRTA